MHSGLFGCLTKRGAKRVEKCKSSCHKVTSEFFATNPLDPLHWTLNSCFGAYHTVWVHLRPFGCLEKLGAKRFELLQKFVPRRHVGVFRDEHTRSTPLDPKLMFCCVSYYLAAFWCIWDHLVANLGAKRSRVGIFHNESTRSTPLDPKLMFYCVSYYLGAIGTVWLPYETRCKTGRTSAKVRATKSHRNFLQRTYPIDPIRP